MDESKVDIKYKLYTSKEKDYTQIVYKERSLTFTNNISIKFNPYYIAFVDDSKYFNKVEFNNVIKGNGWIYMIVGISIGVIVIFMALCVFMLIHVNSW